MNINFTKALCLITIAFSLSLLSTAQISLVKAVDIYQGASEMMVANGKLFFAADDGTHGYELWTSDGTPGGTNMLVDIHTGDLDGMYKSNTFSLAVNQANTSIVYKNEYYFLASDGSHSYEIWKSDGTVNGTKMLKDINPSGSILGQYNNDLPFFAIANGILFFQADDGQHGAELWKTDGTELGTELVKDVFNGGYGSEPWYLTSFKNEVYFRAWGENYGEEVWKSDGSPSGTVMLKDIYPGNISCFYSNSSWEEPFFKVSGNYLYFRANIDSPLTHFHIWRTDGTPGGTVQVEDHLELYIESVLHSADVNSEFYFLANDDSPGNLWKSNGTVGTAAEVTTNNNLSAISSLYNFDGVLVFAAYADGGYGLGRSDGTTGGSYMVKTFPSLGSAAEPKDFVTLNNNLFFGILMAIDPSAMEWRLGQSNGTASGTVSFPHYGYIGGLVPFNNKIYFAGYDTIINSGYTVQGLYVLEPLTTLGINEAATNQSIQVYPNPANDIVTCQWQTGNVMGMVLSDITGRKILEEKTSTNKAAINTHSLPPGIYFLTLTGKNNSSSIKLIKE